MTASKLLTSLLIVFASNSYAGDNSIYIDQAGDNAIITILQDGAGNRVRGLQGAGTGNSTPASIIGNNVNLSINQTGSNNSLDLGLNATVSAGRSVDLTYSTVDGQNISGSNNTAKINLNANGAGVNTNTLISIVQLNGGNGTDVNVLGAGNTIGVRQAGGGATFNSIVNASNTVQAIDTSGGTANSVTTNLTSDKGRVEITAVGASNTFNVTQSGVASANGHTATMDVIGSSNTVTLSQSGGTDQMLNLRISGTHSGGGNGNVYNITQR